MEQEVVRAKVLKILKKNPQVLTKVSNKIGIGALTFVNFLKGKDVDAVRLCKIILWVKDHE